VPVRDRYAGLLRRLGHQRWFAWVGRRVTPLDRWLRRRTKGRWSLSGDRTTPALLLTTTGRKSGLPREQPLLYATDGGSYVVVGSNWGQAGHPAWSANLLADPAAVVDVDGTRVPVRASLCTGAERERMWALLAAVWPAYDSYDRRAGRELRVFRLTPEPAPEQVQERTPDG
jgi:deazaflavin-dependent oxidoreductase (nitroreductase family)